MATLPGADGALAEADAFAICDPCAGADAATLAVAERRAWRPDAAARSQPDAEA